MNFICANDTFRWWMLSFQSPFEKNKIWIICKAICFKQKANHDKKGWKFFDFIEAVIQRCFVKKVFLKILQKSQENPCARVSFLIKWQLKKRLWHRCFPVNITKFLRTLIFIEHLRFAASDFRSTHRKYSVEKGVLKNFANFTGKQLCWSLFLTKLQTFSALQLY